MRITIKGVKLDVVCKNVGNCPAGTAYYYVGVCPQTEDKDWPMEAVIVGERVGPMYGMVNIDQWIEAKRVAIESAIDRLGLAQGVTA